MPRYGDGFPKTLPPTKEGTGAAGLSPFDDPGKETSLPPMPNGALGS